MVLVSEYLAVVWPHNLDGWTWIGSVHDSGLVARMHAFESRHF